MLLATLVRYHGKAVKPDEMPRFTLFKKKQFLPMVFLLRLSTLLNNQRQATTRPDSLTLTTDEGNWTLTFPQGYFSQNTLVQLDFEREQTYWNDVSGWKLTLKEE